MEGRQESGEEPESEREIVSVTAQGQATIPKRFRDELAIEAPGKVQFRKTETGQIVVEPPSDITRFRGALATSEEESATDILQESREEDEQREAEKFDRFLGE